MTLAAIGDAAPEKKAYIVAMAALNGATGDEITAMLTDPAHGAGRHVPAVDRAASCVTGTRETSCASRSSTWTTWFTTTATSTSAPN